MDRSDSQAYYRARAATSRDLARLAANPAVAAVHNELAVRYEALAGEPDVQSGAVILQA